MICDRSKQYQLSRCYCLHKSIPCLMLACFNTPSGHSLPALLLSLILSHSQTLAKRRRLSAKPGFACTWAGRTRQCEFATYPQVRWRQPGLLPNLVQAEARLVAVFKLYSHHLPPCAMQALMFLIEWGWEANQRNLFNT